MIELKYTFASAAELLAHLTALGSVPAAQATTQTTNKVTKPKADAVVLTTTQTAAVDDTAGVGNAQNPPAKAASTEPTASGAAGGAQQAKAETSAPAVAYPDLQKAVFKLAAADRPAVIELAAGFGVKNFKELDSSKYGEALAAVEAKLAQLEVA